MGKIFEIESLVIEYTKARQRLIERYNELEKAIGELKRGASGSIRKASLDVVGKKQRLECMIAENKELFQKPKTTTIHGVKIGFQKGKGKLEWDDAAQVVKLIRKHFPKQADLLIKVEEKPAAKALANLDVAELKTLGVNVHDAGDQVVVKPMESKIDDLINELCKELFKDETDEAVNKLKVA